MCCRYYMEESPELKPFVDAANRSSLKDHIVAKLGRPLVTSGEVRPTDLCVVAAPDRNGKRAAFPMIWGFTGQRSYLFNTRVESADQKPLWRESFSRRRCIIPASWYFEWQHLKSSGGKQKTGGKYKIRPRDTAAALIAGIYHLEEHDGIWIPHFSILTREPGDEIKFIHDRMPVILNGPDAAIWVDPKADMDAIKKIASGSLTGMMFEKAE